MKQVLMCVIHYDVIIIMSMKLIFNLECQLYCIN